MITDQLVTYEVAKLAKEKGFPQDVFGTCEMKSSCYLEDGRYYKDGCIYPIENAYTAPTQSLLQRWLREEKWLHINIDYNHPNKSWTPTIIRMDCIPTRDTPYRLDLPSSSSYEVALEKALIYALNMLPSRETSQ